MGCCFSSEEDKEFGYIDPDERTRLLDPTGGNSSTSSLGHQGQQDGVDTYRKDEQSVMARIVHQNAREIIDVASNETGIEQNEYNDRSRLYSRRLKTLLMNSGKKGSFQATFPNGITSPNSVLAAPPVSTAEIQLICITSDKFSRAMRDVRVSHGEDLVISFGLPMP